MAAIHLAILGSQSTTIDSQGNLVMQTSFARVTEQAPVLYQLKGGLRRRSQARLWCMATRSVSMLAPYNASVPLDIDPVLSYATYFPAAQQTGLYAMALDGSDNTYLTGADDVVAKMNATGTALEYITYLGGSNGAGWGIAVDSAGDAYVSGYAGSDFPTTSNAFSTAGNAYVAVLNPNGSGLLYSTLVPGVQASSFPNSGENAEPFLAVDSSGNIDVTGNAGAGFVTTVSAYQPSGSDNNNAFLAKFDPNLSGTASLLYSTYLGGSGADQGTGVAVNSAGNAFITGLTSSSNFPTTAGTCRRRL